MTTREMIIEKVNELFVYTDDRHWQLLLDQVLCEEVLMDMSSAGGSSATVYTAKDICRLWHDGFKGLDAVHHQAGNYIVKHNGDEASVFCYAIAIHYKAAAYQGKTREYVGSYDIGLVQTLEGWRIKSFVYHLKYINGNISLQ